jgi:hypothetical protein
MKPRHTSRKKNMRRDLTNRRTDVEGQNPKADDAPDKDVYHDENRRNLYDPEVGRFLKYQGKALKA